MSVPPSPVVRLAQRYLLRERIAVGGMGEVHLATDERLARPVAVKVLGPRFADDPEAVERFRREALTAARLDHPAVAQVYDYGVESCDDGHDDDGPGTHFLVMEHVPGPDLARVLRDKGRLGVAEAVDVTAQVCAALAAAHDAGVVHRDVKPGNVMLTAEGRVKVTDFGIARVRGLATLTDAGAVLGTAAYLSRSRCAARP
ncbi:protein kinase [Terrabacter sp. NPDC000476]|uniref:protein kinase domain-containing protein n=1 Tax=Terrabacter sp. NPDC000476 TaxID=3154258 RepID=UPI00332F3A1E